MDDAKITEIYYRLRSKKLEQEPITLKIDEFKALYNKSLALNQRQVPRVVVINLEDQAYVLFPEWSRQEVIVEGTKSIETEDFSFLSMVDWRGAKGPRAGFFSFIVHEITENWRRITGILLASIIILLFVGPALSTYDLIHTLLIQASTVFLSIYLIFTVSQSERLSYDRKLFDKGTLHKYYADDRNITQFGILTVGMVFANSILVSSKIVNSTLQDPLPYATGRWIAAISTSVVLSMLFHTFFIVADYYLERTRDVAEREHVGQVLHEEYCREHPEDCETAK
jgi:hypothetical protein